MVQRIRVLSVLLMILAGVVFPIFTPSAAEATDCLSTPNSNGCRAGLSVVEYQQLLDEMVLYPAPDVRQVPPNQEELDRFVFRRLINAEGTAIFDSPGGNQISWLDAGFNYVSVSNSVEGWIEMNPGQWVRESDTAPVRPSGFSGVYVNPDAPYTFAWILYPSRPSAYPGGPENEDMPRLERYTIVNIYHSVEVDGWRWYLVAPDQWIRQTYVGKALYIDRPAEMKGRWFAVDLYEQVLVAYEEDTPVFATLISSGLPDWSTNEGTFETWARIANAPMSGAEGQSDFYRLENVPWTLYFDGDISLHGTYWHDGFGYRHSHGCVNMSITDSHWAFQWTQEGGYDLPGVHVWASGIY